MRICKQCGKQYEKVQGISFTKYCSAECQEIAKTRYYKVGNRICKHCGKEFEVSKKHKLYCSTECERIAISGWKKDYERNVKTMEWKKEHYTKKKGVCVNCGEEFERVPNSRDTMRFCSRECSDAYMSEERSRESKERKQRQMFEGVEQIAFHFNKCKCCGKTFLHKKEKRYCSDECEKQAMREYSYNRSKERAEARECECKWCGKKFMGRYKESYNFCSEECRKEHVREQKHINSRKRLKGKVVDKDISIAKLIARDGGVCGICGRKIDESDFTRKDGWFVAGELYPTIDHIKPLAKGGLHEWSNVQLAHMGCNRMKRDTYDGEGLVI